MLESALYQLTKQVCGIRGNPKRENVYKAVDIESAEELVNLRTEHRNIYEADINNRVIQERFRSQQLLTL